MGDDASAKPGAVKTRGSCSSFQFTFSVSVDAHTPLIFTTKNEYAETGLSWAVVITSHDRLNMQKLDRVGL